MKKLFLLGLVISLSFPALCQTFGKAINLDGNDDYGIVPHHASLNPGDGSWSVIFWLNAANKDQISPVVMKRIPQSPYTQYSYGFGKDDPHDPLPGKRFRINHIADAGVSERSGHTIKEYIDGDWHHYAVIADKQKDSIIIFIDGQIVGFVPLFYYGKWPKIEITNDLILAKGSAGDKIEGIMDELSIWNKALNSKNIQLLMHDTISPAYYRTADSGLIAYFRFESFENLSIRGGGADDIRDLSSFGNHADFEGQPNLIPSGIPTGIEIPNVKNTIILFPNPASNLISISGFKNSTNYTIKLEDLNGRNIAILYKGIPTGHTMEFDIKLLQNGVYICHISFGNQGISKKLVIQR
jgi:Concanavalin A-like lectin/glucanases superfamily/Secretion system C-terminal sorting domain